MTIKVFPILCSFVIISCYNENEIKKSNSPAPPWTLSGFHASCTFSCYLSGDEIEEEPVNVLLEELLGFNDANATTTTLRFIDDHHFEIAKNDVVTISGELFLSRDRIVLSHKEESIEFKNVSEYADTLLLHTDVVYNHISNVRFKFTR